MECTPAAVLLEWLAVDTGAAFAPPSKPGKPGRRRKVRRFARTPEEMLKLITS